jgi:small-conductance mechanosensitive channel
VTANRSAIAAAEGHPLGAGLSVAPPPMTERLSELLSARVLGNAIDEYGLAVAALLAVFVALRLAKSFLAAWLAAFARRTETELGDLFVRLLGRIGPVIYAVVSLDIAMRMLVLPAGVVRGFDVLVLLAVSFKTIQMLQDVVLFAVERWVTRGRPDDPGARAASRNVSAIARLALWLVGGIFVLSNLGLDVSSVIAGLGIGGIAVALAAQAVLKDAFSAFAIWMDKPFEVGDFIIVGDMRGTVEYVGFKTTRLRSLEGEQLVFSNADLTDSRVRNYKRMAERRVLLNFGVVYQTPLESLREIPGIVRAIIESQERARFDRAHFQGFGDSALNFEAVFYVLSPDYNTYMDVQQAINVRLIEELGNRGVEFAYPTRQLYVTQLAPRTDRGGKDPSGFAR